MDEQLTFGQWLKQRRRAHALTQKALGQLVAYSPETIRKIESNQFRPSQEMAERLADALGIEAEERALFVQFARDELPAHELPPAALASAPRYPSPAPPPDTLPLRLATFVGRERELEALQALLRGSDARLVTLTGAGGIGKTTLAIEAARGVPHHFPSGIYLVPLGSATDMGQVIAAIAQGLSMEERGPKALSERLKSYLRDKRALLVLDNFEHVLSAAPLITDLLQAAPRLSVLVTSRELLHLYGEHEFPLPPLCLPDQKQALPLSALADYDAVALFVERARAIQPAFRLTAANAAAVVELCTRLDGLPLAIELAAARSKLLTPQAMLSYLPGRLELLTGRARGLPTRQRTLRATIEWSYRLLESGEQRLFRRLALFAGGSTLEALTAVFRAAGELPGDVLVGVESLLDKSLLAHKERPGQASRLVLLETVHEYAHEKLVASGELDALRDHHLDYFLQLAEAAEPHIWGMRQVEWLGRLANEMDNLRKALEWALTDGREEKGLRLAGALGWFWIWNGPTGEGLAYVTSLLERTAQQPGSAARAKALTVAAHLAVKQRDIGRAESLAEHSLHMGRALGEKRSVLHALIARGDAAGSAGKDREATAFYREALALAREIGDKPALALLLNSLGNSALERGESADATAFYEEALELFRETGNKWCISFQLRGLALSAAQQGPKRRHASTLKRRWRSIARWGIPRVRPKISRFSANSRGWRATGAAPERS